MLLATAAQGAPPPPYVVSSLPDNARLTIYSEYLPDPDGTLSLEAVTAGDYDGRFKPASRFVERLGLSDHAWWVRIAVQNELGHQRRFALMQGPRHYFDSAFFLPGDGGYRAAGPGERFVHRTPVYLVDLPPGEPRVFYWRVNPRGSLVYSIKLSTLPAALGNDPLFALYWLLFGVMLALAAYNGLVALMRGGLSHGYHAGFLLALAGLVLFSSGILAGHSLIGAGLPQLKMGSLMLAILCACGVGRTFVDSRHNAPLLDRLVPWLPIAGALAAAFGLGLAAAALLVALGYQAWHREVPLGALYFFTSLLVGSPVVLACLTMLGLIQSNVDLGLCVMITVNLAGFIQAAGLRIQHHQHLHMKMERRRSQSVAETVDTTRRETLARMGHDVRTPLSGILGMAEILEDTPLTPNQKDCVGGIRNAGESLLKIINDVLEYSQLSDQGADINREALDANELLMGAVDLFRERAEEKQVLRIQRHGVAARYLPGAARPRRPPGQQQPQPVDRRAAGGRHAGPRRGTRRTRRRRGLLVRAAVAGHGRATERAGYRHQRVAGPQHAGGGRLQHRHPGDPPSGPGLGYARHRLPRPARGAGVPAHPGQH